MDVRADDGSVHSHARLSLYSTPTQQVPLPYPASFLPSVIVTSRTVATGEENEVGAWGWLSLPSHLACSRSPVSTIVASLPADGLIA
jgi:hypothetical protein